MPTRPDFSEIDQAKIVHMISTRVHDDISTRREWITKRAEALEALFPPTPETKDTPWKGASNVPVPLTTKLSRTVMVRLTNALLATEPLAQASPVDPSQPNALEDADARAAYLNYQLLNEVPNFRREISTWILDSVHGGSQVIMPWVERRRTIVPTRYVIDNFQMVGTPENPGTIAKTDREALGEVLPGINKARPLGKGAYRVRFIEDGREQTALSFVERRADDLRDDQMAIMVEKEIHETRLRVKTQNVEDWILPAGATGYQSHESNHLTRIIRLTPDQIRENSSWHNLTTEDLQKLEAFTGTLDLDTHEVEDVKDTLLGVKTTWGTSGIQDTAVMILEHYTPYWLEFSREDGKLESRRVEMIFWTIPALNKLARWEYHRTVFQHGLRPVVDFAFVPLSNRPDGVGVYHLTKPYQDEAEVLINQMNDRENLQNNPIVLYEQFAGLNVSAFKSRRPGMAFQVRHLDRIAPFTWNTNPHGGFPIFQFCNASAEQAVGVGDPSTGVQPTRPNAPRTARGTLAIIGEANISMDFHVMLLQEAFSKLLAQIDGLNEQYFPPEVQFPITGKREVGKLTRDQFKTRVKYFLTGNTVNTNPQVKQQIAQFLAQVLGPDPFFTGEYLSMPQSTIQSRWKLMNHLIREHVPGRDASFILPPLEELLQSAEQFQQQQAQAQQEKNDLETRRLELEEARATADTHTRAFTAASKERQAQQQQDQKTMEMLSG